MAREVMIIQTGTANTASVMAGLARAGARPLLGVDAEAIRKAERVVLPGVGALAAAMGRLDQDGLVEVLRERVVGGRPTLAICLGLQLLCQSSEESPGVAGLGLISARATRYPDTVLVPQMGWNRVEPDPACRYLTAGFAYFANSYRLETSPAGWATARTDHAGPFVAAVERGDVVACQFHPELSGPWGQALIERWLTTSGEAV